MTDELIVQLKRIADALEAGNKIIETANTISENHIALQKQWRKENVETEQGNQKRHDEWMKWQKEQKQLENERQERINAEALEQSTKLQQEFSEAMLAKYEAQLRENPSALFAPPVRSIATMADLGEE